MEHPEGKNTPASLTDQMRVFFKGILDPIGAFFNKLGISPNTITLLGLFGHAGAAVLLAFGKIQWAGLLVLLMGPLDAVDGTMARLRGKPTRFGAFLDSVVDRYAELILLGGLLIFYLQQPHWLGEVLVYATAVGSTMVSYTRARGEGLGIKITSGLFTRVERYIVIIASLLFNIPLIGLWILAIFTNLTALQRILAFCKQAGIEDRNNS